MLKHYDFLCQSCGCEFDDYVEGVYGTPQEGCPACKSTSALRKLPNTWASPTTIVVDYPGSKRFKAGYAHLYNRPSEKNSK